MKKVTKNDKTKLIKSKIAELKKIYKPKLVRSLQLSEFLVKKEFYTFPKYVSYKYQVFKLRYGECVVFTVYFALLVYFIGWFGEVFDLVLNQDNATSFFISAATMIGASLAIVATFGQFTIQYVAEKLPKDFYSIAINMKKYFLIFWCLCALTFGLFLEGLLYGRLHLGLSESLVQLGLLFIGSSFYLIYFLFRAVVKDTNLNNILKTVKENTVGSVTTLFNRTKRYAEIMLLHPDNRDKYKLEQSLARLFQENTVQMQLKYIVQNTDFLFDYHDQLFHNHQTSAALEILGIIESVVLEYINVRKGSSLVFPNREAPLVFTSDSAHVLQPILERMRRLSVLYMDTNVTHGIQRIINIFQRWASEASEVIYLGLDIPENPILEQITGYFNFIVRTAKDKKSEEFMFQSGDFYQHVLRISLAKNYLHIFSATLGNLEKLGISGIVLNQDGVVKQTFDIYDTVLRDVVSGGSYQQDSRPFNWLIESIEKVTLMACTVHSTNTVPDTYILQQSISKPLNTLREQIGIYAQKALQATNDAEREGFMETVLWVQDEYQKVLGGIARNLKNPNHFIITSIAPNVRDVGLILLGLSENTSLSSYKDKLISKARLYAVLPESFINQGKNIANEQEIECIVDAITTIGLKGLNVNAIEVGESAMESLSGMAMRILDNSGTMYVECDVLEHACYLGILANKHNLEASVEKLKSTVLNFMEKYKVKYYTNVPEGVDLYNISPPPDKLKRDLESLVTERQRWAGREFPRVGIYEAKQDLFGQVTAEDITNFINKVWGS